MVPDPRCPHCNGKVSSTATWCMHCGEDFEYPVDADSGRAIDGRNRQATGAETDAGRGGSGGSPFAGLLLAIVALVTLPVVSPPNVTLLYLGAVVGIGVYASRQPTAREALGKGGSVLAVVPFGLLVLSLFVNGFDSVSIGSLFGPIVYAVVVSTVAQWAR